MKRLVISLLIMEILVGCKTYIKKPSIKNDINIVNGMLGNDDLMETKADNKGFNPLQESADKGYLETAKLLLDRGAKVDSVGEYRATPLTLASWKGHYEIAELLIENKANVNGISNSSPPIYGASIMGHINVLKLLIENDADVNLKDENGFTALHGAGECTENVFLNISLDENSMNLSKRELRLLHEKVSKQCFQVTNYLIKNRADVNTRAAQDLTPLHIVASRSDNADLAELLIANGADINAKDDSGMAPLHDAAGYGRYDLVVLLIEKGAKINDVTTEGSTPLHLASMTGRVKIVKILVSNGANINATNKYGSSPLHLTTIKNELWYASDQLEVCKFLVNKGANINARNKDGKTPLTLAKVQGRKDMVKFLISAGGVE